MVNTAYAEHETGENDNGTEFHVVDDLYVGGWGGTWSDADVEIYGFSMFGSTTAYNNRWGDWANLEGKMPTTSTGAVVILGDLAVGSTAYFHRGVEFNAISTFTAGAYFPSASKVNFVSGSSVTFGDVGNIYIPGGADGQALFYDANDGSLKWMNPSSVVSGDNLGNHIATKTLDMAGYNIIHLNELQWGSGGVKISSATTQFGGEGAGVLISTHAEVSGQLYVGNAATMASTLNVTGNATMSANLTVNGNSTLGDNADVDTLTVKAHTTIEAETSPTSGEKFLQVGSGSNIVAYFKKK
jgi:hypothetical protein